MISKELLSEVLELKYPIRIIHHFCKGQNVLNYDLHVECSLFQESINIYELAHKCKEWAIKIDYKIESHIHLINKRIIGVASFNTQDNTTKFFQADTEHETIFKACEWIMEQTK